MTAGDDHCSDYAMDENLKKTHSCGESLTAKVSIKPYDMMIW
jgi:hypothetical protein